ncbi:MAG TPA: hypothetical protein VFJ30_09670, partial [Phycisphaerae bacterium]|nr:hypothetical protein [Phycisphaerae bacterium]
LEFRLAADKDTAKSGLADNLIVEAFRELVPKAKKGAAPAKKRRWSIGFLPAIPVEIVRK